MLCKRSLGFNLKIRSLLLKLLSFMNITCIAVGTKAKTTIITFYFNTLYFRVSLEALCCSGFWKKLLLASSLRSYFSEKSPMETLIHAHYTFSISHNNFMH